MEPLDNNIAPSLFGDEYVKPSDNLIPDNDDGIVPIVRHPGTFDFIENIFNGKKSSLLDPDIQSEYNPFLTNIAMSNYPDTLIIANAMNRFWDIPKMVHHKCLFYCVSKRKRYSPWPKKTDADDIVKMVQEFFSYNERRAREVLPLLSQDDLNNIKAKMDTGGKGKQSKTTKKKSG